MLRALLLLALVTSSSSWAKPYKDTRARFALEQPDGWQLAPLPGDTQGMVFRKVVDGVPGTLRVAVRVIKPGETTKMTLDEVEETAKAELGYKRGGDVPTSVGLLPAMRRTFSVYASGDESTVRAIEVIALHAYGHAHILHFETLQDKRKAFTRDLDKMMASYQALIGKGVYATLVGTWINQAGGPELILEEDGRYQLGPLRGGYQADGGKLVLRVGTDGEAYRYVLEDNILTLSSPNLGDEMKFKRSGAPRVKIDQGPAQSTGPLTREQLIGTWRVIDNASTDVLKLQLGATGSVSFGPLSGRWRFSTGRLTIMSVQNVEVTYSASMNEGKLVLAGGDLDRDLTFIRD